LRSSPAFAPSALRRAGKRFVKKVQLIATDLTHLQVQLGVDQADVGDLQVGRPVTFEVESYPDETFKGVASQVGGDRRQLRGDDRRRQP
jgi:multidrug resistance efflux pump